MRLAKSIVFLTLLAITNLSLAQFTSLEEALGQTPGIHSFDFGDGPFDAYVDEDGWVLWLQYHHMGGTSPELNLIGPGNDLPVYDPSGLGTDNSGDFTKWGHGNRAFASTVPDERVWLRWQGSTSHHDRIIHFESPLLGQWRDDADENFIGIDDGFIPRDDHTANLPLSAQGTTAGDDYALTKYPFYRNAGECWNIKYAGNGWGNDWLVDDSGVTDEYHTIHRVWMKYVAIDDNAVKDAIANLVNHINGTIPLTVDEILSNAETIEANPELFASDTSIINKAFGLTDTFEQEIGPLFFEGTTTQGGFNRDINSSPNLELERTIFDVQQLLIDSAFSTENLELYPDVFENRKFETSTFFPGAVDPPTNPNETHDALINGSFEIPWGRYANGANPDGSGDAMRPTGLYLAPGSVAEITVPANLVGKGFSIRVGAHGWDLSSRPPVRRLDRVSKVYPIISETTLIANPLGGGIYIKVPEGANEGVLTITAKNVVKAPFYSHKEFDKTSLSDWLASVRNNPAPWADFESNNVMFQVPSLWIRNFDDPETIMEEWDESFDAILEVLGRPTYCDKHHFYAIIDVTIKSGVYSPGYPTSNNQYNPLSTSVPENPMFVAGRDHSMQVNYHEFGHQIQISKFPGEIEAVVNFLYVMAGNKAMNYTVDEAFQNSFSSGLNIFIDDAAETRMLTEGFRNGLPRVIDNLTTDEVRYQHRGYAHYAEITTLFGWCALTNFWYNENVDYMDGIDHGVNNQDTDDRTFRMSVAAGVDLRPLLQFYGIYPEDPEALATRINTEGLVKSLKIYNRLQEYKQLIPANNAEFLAHALERHPDGLGDGSDNPDYGRGFYYVWSNIYDETYAQATQDALQDLIDLYYPAGEPSNNDPDFKNEDCNDLITFVNETNLAQNNFSISPNPAKEFLMVNSENKTPITSLKIIDALGNTVFKLNNIINEDSRMDISQLAIGAYIVSITNKDGLQESLKFIKIK